MSGAWLYAGVTAAVAAVVAAAVWRPRPGQWVLLLAGPLLAAGAAVASVYSGPGSTVLLVITYTYLLVPAALAWERAWARWAVPGIVVAGCLALGTTASAGPAVLVLLAAPFAIGVLALFRSMARGLAGERGIRRERDRRRFGYQDATAPSSVPVIERTVVAVSTLQGLAGVAVIGLGMLGLVLEQRHPTTGIWGPSGTAISVFLAGLGVAIAVPFLGLAKGLSRQYDWYRPLFVVAQVLVGVLLLSSGASWVAPGAAWALGTGALAMSGSDAPATAD